jgi:hypothetical protein
MSELYKELAENAERINELIERIYSNNGNYD